MKKYLVIAAMSLLFTFGLFTPTKVSSSEIPDIIDDANRCRCKQGGCYGGNLISVRPKCAISTEGPINCRAYDSNCRGGDPDPDESHIEETSTE